MESFISKESTMVKGWLETVTATSGMQSSGVDISDKRFSLKFQEDYWVNLTDTWRRMEGTAAKILCV